jgi:hypothetical protein
MDASALCLSCEQAPGMCSPQRTAECQKWLIGQRDNVFNELVPALAAVLLFTGSSECCR